MAVATHHTTLGDFGANVLQAEYLQKRFQDELFNNMVAYPLGMKGDLPQGVGVTVTWNKFAKHTVTITANTEGDSGFPTTFTTTTVQATLKEYVAHAEYSELLDMTAMSGTIERLSRNLAYKMAYTIDYLCLSTLNGITNTNDAGVAMTAEEIRKAAQELATLNAPHHSSTPGGQFYAGLLSPEQFYDMLGEGAPTWVQAKRDELTNALTTPWASTAGTSALYDVMIKKSSNILAVSSEDYGYVLGDGAFGCVEMGPAITSQPDVKGYAPSLIWTRPSENIVMPARNKGIVAVKAYFVATILDQNQAVEVKSDVT